jgi:hypothetical protein
MEQTRSGENKNPLPDAASTAKVNFQSVFIYQAFTCQRTHANYSLFTRWSFLCSAVVQRPGVASREPGGSTVCSDRHSEGGRLFLRHHPLWAARQTRSFRGTWPHTIRNLVAGDPTRTQSAALQVCCKVDCVGALTPGSLDIHRVFINRRTNWRACNYLFITHTKNFKELSWPPVKVLETCMTVL